MGRIKGKRLFPAYRDEIAEKDSTKTKDTYDLIIEDAENFDYLDDWK